MAFPTTSILDAFTRAAGTAPPSANWTAQAGFAADWITTGTTIKPNSTSVAVGDYWNAATFGPDSEVYCTLPAAGNGSATLVLYLRWNNGTQNGYRVAFTNLGGSPAAQIGKVTGGSVVALGANTSLTVNAGDKLGFEAIGSTLTVYRFNGTSWSSVVSVTDSTYSVAGLVAAAAFCSSDGTLTIDDFGGGTVVSGSVPAGGAVAVTGTAKVGQVLTATNSGWTNTPTSYQYLWQHADDAGFTTNVVSIQTDTLAGTTDTYTVAPADDTKYLRCQAVAINGAGSSTAAISAATAQVVYGSAPVNTAAPVIAGITSVGQTLSVTTEGTYDPA